MSDSTHPVVGKIVFKDFVPRLKIWKLKEEISSAISARPDKNNEGD